MRVKIIKATLPSFWYAGQIGSEFNVEEHTHDKYKLIKDVTLSSTISKSDCEILPEENPQPEQFDLERALKGEVIIKDYTKMYVLCQSRNGIEYVCETVKEGDGSHTLLQYSLSYLESWFMAPKEPQVVKRWINVFNQSGDIVTSGTYKSEMIAIESGKHATGYLKTIPFTFTT